MNKDIEKWIYGDNYSFEYTKPGAAELIERVEAALGFKLFFWQKAFIFVGHFRRYGETQRRFYGRCWIQRQSRWTIQSGRETGEKNFTGRS